ncbi:unnamed protein product [Ceutorhynchus assimilis]|uniref:Uncharacterized protein n=1 Tax=Ceutorhynchus assimilis TaxID=467358 RepID=A0A9N9MS17_9CUCU|nr:unnamed protein product [Ceutorhynchus assimilis]
MAPSLRYIHKLSGHLLANKHLGLNSFVNNYCKQYSRSLPEFRLPEASCNDLSLIPDNREVANDVVTKINIVDLYSTQPAPKKDVLLSSNSSPEPGGKPSPEKLLQVYTILGESLPNLFVQPMDYTIYHDNIIFEDNIRNIRTEGLYNYVKQVALLRTVGHFKFAYVKFEILKITQHPEDGTVRIRWTIRGISALKVMFHFWKVKVWKYREMINHTVQWHDGYSTFYINSDGKIVKHVADKMMPDSDRTVVPPVLGNAKLAMMLAVIPKVSDLGWFV